MTTELPPALREVVDRIMVPPFLADPDPATGALGHLATWWAALSPDVAGSRPQAVALHPRRIADGPPGQARESLVAGIEAADGAIDAGATLLVLADAGADLPARAAIALLARREASAVLPQPAGMTDAEWMLRCSEVRDLAAAALEHRGDPIALLERTGADEVAFAVGALLAAAARRVPCLLDGTTSLAAAVVADRINYRARGWWLAASDSPDSGRTTAIDRVDLPIAVTLGTSDDDGRAAAAVLALLHLDADVDEI